MSGIFSRPLYHGTIDRIERIELERGRRNKDFGQGFYLAFDVHQSIGMMHKRRREILIRNPKLTVDDIVERLYRVQLKPSSESLLNIKIFENVDLEWLDFVLMCRASTAARPHPYDMVVGATADDDTMIALKLYRNGAYGEVGSLAARQDLLRVLEPHNLGRQCCLCTPKAVEAVMSMSLVDWRLQR